MLSYCWLAAQQMHPVPKKDGKAKNPRVGFIYRYWLRVKLGTNGKDLEFRSLKLSAVAFFG